MASPGSGPTPAQTVSEKNPESFGRYLLLSCIGIGGMAEVFRAVAAGSEGFRRLLVVKRIRSELSALPEFVRMFSDEARISALLSHPNIVQVYDFGQISQSYFMVMEYLDGRDLKSVMAKLRARGMAMPPALAAYVAEQAAAGLFHAHSLSSPDGKSFGIIHRDVNPSNIMLLRSGAVKVLDFGIAKASAALGKVQTRNAMLKGKLSYMSPEQARCASIDARSDIFSLGVTLWEMLTGKRLFRGPTDFDRVQNVLNAPIVPPSHVRPEVPAALDSIVMRALAREVSGRYETAEEMEGELEAFLRTTPVDSHALKKLLRELFGGHPTENTLDIPAFDSTVTPAEVLGHRTDSHPTKMERLSGRHALLDSFSSTMSASGRWPGSADRTSPSTATGASEVSRQSLGGSSTTTAPVARGFPWTWIFGGAAAAVAAVMLMSWTGGGWHVPSRASGRSRVGATDDRLASAPSSGEVVRIEIDTSPSGAKVYDARGLAGTTPLTLTLDASEIPAALRLEHAGFEDLHTEISSRSSGVIFLELKRAGRL